MALSLTADRPDTAPPPRRRQNINLTLELAWSQFKLKYTGSVLGYVWSLLKPLMLFSIMYTIFVVLFKQRDNEFALQLLVGIVLFTFFTDTTSGAMGSVAGAGHLIRKAWFPRSILVIASSLTALLTMTINLALIIAVALPLGHLHFGWRSLALPLLLVELYAFCLGISLILSALFVSYRDLGHIWEILTQVLFYMSGVVYPATIVPAHWRNYFFMNPLAQILEDARHAIVVPQVPWTSGYVGAEVLIPLAIVVTTVVLGIVTFRHLSPAFAENL